MITAVADILAGMSIVHFVFDTNYFHVQSVLYLSISTLGLYGGGVVFNDVLQRTCEVDLPDGQLPGRSVKRVAIEKQARHRGVLLEAMQEVEVHDRDVARE